ncbi:hypothetical protein Pint_21782 [Pistacia integerrima]|uniref:Uncharacterized protein n=1 Tax=Pistacia integerrima TaxID=434235 RepID=A0ACC0XAT9_9ROSI|nr:hypothetical protein Pint_21782 [Pistacia integerrima]
MVEPGVGPCFSEANRGNGCHEGFMQFILILQCYHYMWRKALGTSLVNIVILAMGVTKEELPERYLRHEHF